MDLDTQAALPLTYPKVDATATSRLSAGFGHLSVSFQIGSSQERFERATDAVMHWGMRA